MENKIKTISSNSNRILGRDAVKQIFISDHNSKNLILDMKNIEFLSRAAAHELIFQKEKMDSEGQNLVFKNIRSEVSKMIDSVCQSFKMDKSSSRLRDVFIHKFESDNDLEKFIKSF